MINSLSISNSIPLQILPARILYSWSPSRFNKNDPRGLRDLNILFREDRVNVLITIDIYLEIEPHHPALLPCVYLKYTWNLDLFCLNMSSKKCDAQDGCRGEELMIITNNLRGVHH